MIGIYSFRIPSSLLWVLYWYHGRDGEKQEKNIIIIWMGLHPDNAVWFTRAPCHRVTVLDISSSSQAPPACGCGSRIPRLQTTPVFVHDLQSFLENLGQPLTLLASCIICKWKWSFCFFHLWRSSEKTDQEELWNNNLSLYDTDITPLIHPSEICRGQLHWVTRWGGSGVASVGCSW